MDKQACIEAVRNQAEGYYRRGEFFCSEAVIHTVNQLLGNPFPEDVTKLASAFPIGMGNAGCLCGAVSGGAMALGMAYGRKHGEPMNDKMFPLSAALHDHIRNLYKSTCCRVLIKGYDFHGMERKNHCITITGDVAAWIAEQLLENPEIADRLDFTAAIAQTQEMAQA